MVGLVSAMTMNVLERTREVGILRCLGARGKRHPPRSSRPKGSCSPSPGWVIGIPFGYLLDLLFGWLIGRIFGFELAVAFPPANVLIALVGTIVLALLDHPPAAAPRRALPPRRSAAPCVTPPWGLRRVRRGRGRDRGTRPRRRLPLARTGNRARPIMPSRLRPRLLCSWPPSALYPRIRAGFRAFAGARARRARARGFAIAVADAASGGPHGDAWTGFLLLPAGLTLGALGVVTPVAVAQAGWPEAPAARAARSRCSDRRVRGGAAGRDRDHGDTPAARGVHCRRSRPSRAGRDDPDARRARPPRAVRRPRETARR